MKKGNTLIIVAIIALVTIGAALYFKYFTVNPNISVPSQDNYSSTPKPGETTTNNLKNYTSQALKISFNYPKEWYLDDRYQRLLITNYVTNLNRDDKPSDEQIELLISYFTGCHKTIEENLIDPACGEGGPEVKKNKILSKEMRETKGGTFYKYIVEFPNEKFTYYLLEKMDEVIKISKHPDPSQFEKEFEEIVNSIEFL